MNQKRTIIIAICFVFCLSFLLTTKAVHAQTSEYEVAKIIEFIAEGDTQYGDATKHWQTFKAILLDESEQTITVMQNELYLSNQALTVNIGDKVVVVEDTIAGGEDQFLLVDAYRIPALWMSTGFFVLLVLIFGRLKGLTSLLGLGTSIAVIVFYIVPQIVAGADPLWISLSGSFMIATVSLFLAHGFNKRTLVAYGGTMITLIISVFIAVQTVTFTRLFGTGTEESLFVLSDLPGISLQGLLLGGIMLGLLGVLDDITTAQSAVVDELHQANASLSRKELYRHGISVGREHIASLVNTLVLAYAGAGLPLFLLFVTDQGIPLWAIFNNEIIAEEIVRTLVGSACLILAVPITTYMASWAFQKPHKLDGTKVPKNFNSKGL